MATFVKLIEKFLRKPPEIKYKDVVNVLENFGWELKNIGSGGSHFVYYKEGKEISVPKDKEKVKKPYIIELIKILELEEWYEKHKK